MIALWRLAVTPWWVRGLVHAAVVAVTLLAVAAVLFSKFFTVTGWWWGLLAVAGCSVIISAATVYAQHPMHQRLAALINGLSREQRTQFSTALRRGQAPDDSSALAAAISVGTLVLASWRRTRGEASVRGVNILAWLVPALMIVFAAWAFAVNDIRQGVFEIGLALFLTTSYAWSEYRHDRLTHHLELLRAAARKRATPPTAAHASPALPSRRLWVLVVPMIVIGAAGATMTDLSHRPEPEPDCRTADAAIESTFGADLAAWPIATSDPDLARRRTWSGVWQLQNYAGEASNPAIASHLHRIADLSVRAVSLLQDIRNDETAPASTEVIDGHKTAYVSTIGELLDAQRNLIPICHRR